MRNHGRIFVLSLVLAAGVCLAAQESTPVFKGGVERVALSAVVRDAKGKLVMNLTARDFQLLDSGRPTPLIAVWSELTPASVGLLLDVSGSMATKLERAREAVRQIVAGLQPGVDEAAIFSFDTELKQLRPFSTRINASEETWANTRAFGATSLWDAIATTASRVAERERRRALVVVTDGIDSASRLTPPEVSAKASALDVPVYFVVMTPLVEEDPRETAALQPLTDLATWTGGDLLVVRDPATLAAASRRIVNELQHQYVVAFEPGRTPGWHQLVLRTTKPGLFVRSRSGYMVGASNTTLEAR